MVLLFKTIVLIFATLQKWIFTEISGAPPVIRVLDFEQNSTFPVRLTNGKTEYEGNVEIFFREEWGSVCDDDWGIADSTVVCHQLGFEEGALRSTSDSYFGHTQPNIWLDNVGCSGHETELANCRNNGWGLHDCNRQEAAGVICKRTPVPTTEPPIDFDPNDLANKSPLSLIFNTVEPVSLQISGGRNFKEGRVELGLPHPPFHAVFCADRWTLREAVVICRQLGLMYAQQAVKTSHFGSPAPNSRIITGLFCTGDEEAIDECMAYSLDKTVKCDSTTEFAAVVCNEELPDLMPDIALVQSSIYLHDQALFYLQCAMEEHCLSSSAYVEASFCLEDSDCGPGVTKFYSCQNYGDQGISVGCWDQYLHDIDCQWIDISDLPAGLYRLKITVNPEYRVAETNYTNNAVECDLYYNTMQIIARDCRFGRI